MNFSLPDFKMRIKIMINELTLKLHNTGDRINLRISILGLNAVT